MKDFIKKINKYVILMIVSSLFGMPWFYFRHLIFEYNGPDSIIESIPTFVDYAIRLTVIILLVIDFKTENLKNVVLTCIAAFFFPLLGIVIFSILLIESNRQKTSA
ncbi:hypothetical protein CLV93_11630 [Prolixibacter denitrificans]|uniref:DUF2834 domain-containing protein n=1 Tax=Prolixibacter denitrificans TaxID=1541063 RepID=A0A2P8C679_9BACT|nr:hypothetical protein CLV93_11630 [Prolixibacter denitrificans]GET23008.1 hypothetical protein JCM18694_32540 [Prolixibacter denitrificans]